MINTQRASSKKGLAFEKFCNMVWNPVIKWNFNVLCLKIECNYTYT